MTAGCISVAFHRGQRGFKSLICALTSAPCVTHWIMESSHNSGYTVTKSFWPHVVTIKRLTDWSSSLLQKLRLAAGPRPRLLESLRPCFLFWFRTQCQSEGEKNKTKHGAAVLVLGDASFQSHPFYESIYGPSFCVRHILGFQAGSKSNWTLTHHHKVKFALQYLKLTENIFDIKKQKDSTTRSFPFCLMCSTCRYYIFNHPLNGRGLASKKTGLLSNSCCTTH